MAYSLKSSILNREHVTQLVVLDWPRVYTSVTLRLNLRSA